MAAEAPNVSLIPAALRQGVEFQGIRWWLVPVFLAVLEVGIGASGFFQTRRMEREEFRQTQAWLTTHAESVAERVRVWKDDRRTDGRVLASRVPPSLFSGPGGAPPGLWSDEISAHLERHPAHRVALIHPDGRVVHASHPSQSVTPSVRSALAMVSGTNRWHLTKAYRRPEGEQGPWVSLLVAILDRGQNVAGVLQLEWPLAEFTRVPVPPATDRPDRKGASPGIRDTVFLLCPGEGDRWEWVSPTPDRGENLERFLYHTRTRWPGGTVTGDWFWEGPGNAPFAGSSVRVGEFGWHLVAMLDLTAERDSVRSKTLPMTASASVITLVLGGVLWGWMVRRNREDRRRFEWGEVSRKAAMERLSLLYLAVENSPVGIAISDTGGIIEYVNPAFTTLTGYTPEEVMGRDFRLLKSGHHPRAFYETMWAELNRGQVWKGEVLNRRKDGRFYWEKILMNPVRDGEGRITRYISVREDVTQAHGEWRRLDTLARVVSHLAGSGETQAMLETFLDQILSPLDLGHGEIWMHEPHLRLLRCRAVQSPGGRPWAELVTWTRDMTLDPGAEDPIARAFREQRARWIVSSATDPDFARVADARRIPGRAWMVLPFGLPDRPLGVLAVSLPRESPEDPALLRILEPAGSQLAQSLERVRAHREMERLALVVRHGTDLVVMTRREGRMVFLNDTARQVLGLGPASPALLKFADLLSGDEGRRVEHEILPAIAEAGAWQGELALRHWGDGVVLPVHARAFRIQETRVSQAFLVAWVFRDLTEIRRNETVLREALEKARAGEKAKSTFLAHMGHEIRTPLQAVLGYAQLLLRETDLAPRHRGMIQSVEDGGTHLLAILNDILDLSRLEADRMPVTRASVSLERVVRRVVEIAQLSADAKGLRVVLEIEPGPPPVLMLDSTRVTQVLLNLMGNGVKFTQKGSVTLRLHWSRPPGSDEVLLEFQVLDEGPGILPEEMEAIFEPFTQGDAGRKWGGSGLGLAISRRLAAALGGDLTVAPRIGGGSVFRFTLRAAVSEDILGPVEEMPAGPKGVHEVPAVSFARLPPEDLGRWRLALATGDRDGILSVFSETRDRIDGDLPWLEERIMKFDYRLLSGLLPPS